MRTLMAILIVTTLAALCIAQEPAPTINGQYPTLALAPMPADATKALKGYAAEDTNRTSIGMLWCTETDLTPNLLASYHVADYAGWGIYADLFGAIDLSGGGAGLSADAPDDLPIIAPVRDVLGADRAGVGLYYTTETHSLAAMLYLVTEF